MDDFRCELKEMAAEVNLEILEEIGVCLTYQHRDDTPISVYALPIGGDAKMREWGGTRSREISNSFKVPVQCNFPPDEGPMIDDTFTDEDGNVFAVRDFTTDSLNSVYTFENCVQTTVKQVGAVGQ